eukprot:6561863-Prymnesium_polylepis.1
MGTRCLQSTRRCSWPRGSPLEARRCSRWLRAVNTQVHAGPSLGYDVGLADGVGRLGRPRLASERLDVHDFGPFAGQRLVARRRAARRA